MRVVALDLSTASTGWSVFQDVNLESRGNIVPVLHPKKPYPWGSVFKVQHMTERVIAALKDEFQKADHIVIEEVNKHKNRIQGKVLDSLHFFILAALEQHANKIVYMDSDGATGWRTRLSIRMTPQDSLINKQRKVINRSIKAKNKGKKRNEKQPEEPIIGKKHLACRFVNKLYNLDLDVDQRETDGDVADAVALGHAFVFKVLRLGKS